VVGRTLGQYEILRPLGAGGMGEVYRARDSKLKRDVAIKLLPEDVAGDPERLARLQREAELLAALNHPNIAAIHNLEEHDGAHFLVLELIEGETLEARLGRGALPVDEALDLCGQIAEALEAAHDTGIIHRDLKPANVIVTAAGRAKVLDFGIAKALEPGTGRVPGAGGDRSETARPTALTGTGMILGTAPYMSPEQVRGQPVDARTDIWAFGCILYECLSGKRAFERETVADTLAAIVERDPDWSALPAGIPRAVRRLLERCLQKDPRRRLRHMGDACIEIEEAIAEPSGPTAGAGTDAGVSAKRRRLWALGFAASVVLVATTALGTWAWFRPSQTDPRPTYLSITLEPGTYLWGGDPLEASLGGNRPSRTAIAISPDGMTIVYAATDGETSRLYRRRLDEPATIPIAGTEGASNPFFNPDGSRLGFVAGADIRTVPLEGGEPRTVLADAPFQGDGPLGLSWGPDETIVFDGQGGIFRIPAGGGEPQQMIADAGGGGRLTHLLPNVSILSSRYRHLADFRTAAVLVRPIGGQPTLLIEDAADARYSPTLGHLVFVRRGTLMAARFDPAKFELTSDPVPILDDVMQGLGGMNSSINKGAAQFGFSATGTLIYAAGGIHPEPRTPVVWVSRTGDATAISLPPGYYLYPRLSGDGRLVVREGLTESRIHVRDLATGGTTTLELPGSQLMPVWSPDGTRVAFSSDHEGPPGRLGLYSIDADLSGEPRPVFNADANAHASDWSRDNVLAFVAYGDIWVVDVDGATEPRRLAQPGGQQWPTFSPDGRWFAYASNHTGRQEVYVRPFPRGNPEYPVSFEGGTSPAWSPDGSELFYRAGPERSKMMAVPVAIDGDTFRINGPVRELFDKPVMRSQPIRSYDVSPDGRFIMVEPWTHPPQAVTEIRVVLNWFEELKRLVPVR